MRERMKDHSLWQISVVTTGEAEEAVAALLERLFGQPASVYVPNNGRESVVTVYSNRAAERAFAKRDALEAGLAYIADSGLKIEPAQVSIRQVPREDWRESWKKFFRTIEIGNSLLIKPSWSKQKPKPHQATVVLDPGLSFGTGQHPTTAFCLEQLASLRDPALDQSVLDIGCGSGLLAIAAVKLGYRPVRAFDSDPVAVRVAKNNAKKNRVLHKVTITRSDLTRLLVQSKTRYGVICANLIDSLLIDASEQIIHRLRPDGFLVLAGILENQFPAVQRTYETAGFHLIASRVEQGWKSGTLTRRSPQDGTTR